MMLSAEEAKSIILSYTKSFRNETVSLLEAHDRVLSADIYSKDDIPPFKNSSMDGFAVRSIDTVGATKSKPVELRLQDEVAAGDPSGTSILPSHAIRILTGAPLPGAADTVVPLERIEERSGYVVLTEYIAPEQSTREKGEDIGKGDLVLTKGTLIKAAHLGVLASIGCACVDVFRKPTMAILTTGNELLTVGENLRDGKIRNSNAYSLHALAKESNCVPIDLGVAKDNELELLQKVHEGLSYDLLVTSGGVSAGKYDYVLDAMKKAGVVLKFWKVNIKPGMPLAFGTFGKNGRDVLVFCLPGNPVSSVVTFLEYVRPCIERMMSRGADAPRVRLKATLEEALSKRDGKRHYHRGIVQSKEGKLSVQSTGSQSSGVLTSLVRANCLIILNEQQSTFEKGEEVEIELLPWGNVL
jgi:molybdopterin molybdotransferase